MHARHRILVATQDPRLHDSVEGLALSRGWEFASVGTTTAVLEQLDGGAVSLLVMDEALPGDPDLALVTARRDGAGEPSFRLALALGATSETGHPGADAYLRKPIDGPIGESALAGQIEILELRRALAQLASRDDLTGLANRRAFRERFDEECRRCWRYQRPFSVIMIGLDRLQGINRRFGDQTGDRLLVDAARLCVRELRDMDVVARWGGTEFSLLLPETQLGHALIVAARLRGMLCDLSVGDGDAAASITVSIGVAGLSEEDTTGVEQLIPWAEGALARAKDQGRNGVFFQTPSGAVRFAEVGI